ncbi:Mitochondrial glycoprotein family protein [Hibiscus syriacus]|uniref:Mitochondrial glycoprotein family protein n=1 Tax=Hibiscus syriacus TaxID=106335 RepID=A0A6A2YUP2_HIBSY|nr:Mitochondrial glycoprotein family protein [Hibiscus syriacus]
MAFASILRKSANSLAPLALRLARVQRNYHSCIFTALNQGLRSQQPAVNRFSRMPSGSPPPLFPGNPLPMSLSSEFSSLRFSALRKRTPLVRLKEPQAGSPLKSRIPGGLEFSCTASPDQVAIDSLSFRGPTPEDELAYEGPDFHDLDENMQNSFHKYLEIRGIKPSTTNFLHGYMMNKDNREYANWLKNLKKFVEA